MAGQNDMFAAAEGEFPALRRLIQALRSAPKGRPGHLELPQGGPPIEVPSSLLPVIERAADEMANGLPVAILSADADLTIDEASELLDETPETVSELIGKGEIPHQMVTERRLRLGDVLSYRRQQDIDRADALTELTRLSEDYGLYT